MSGNRQEKQEKIKGIKKSILGEGDLKEEIRICLQELGEDWDLIESAIKELKADIKINFSLSDSQKKRINEADDILLEVEHEEWGDPKAKM